MVVVAAAALIVVMTQRGNNSKSTTLSGATAGQPATDASRPLPITLAQSFGGFVLQPIPSGASPPTSTSAGTSAVGPYTRTSPRQGLLLNVYEFAGVATSEMPRFEQDEIQHVETRDFAPSPAVNKVTTGGVTYTCITGTDKSNGAPENACIWRPTSGLSGSGANQVEGKVLFTLEAIPRLEPEALIALAPQAQAATQIG